MEPEPSVTDYKYRYTLKMTTIFDYILSNINKEEHYYKISFTEWYEEEYKKLCIEYHELASDRDYLIHTMMYQQIRNELEEKLDTMNTINEVIRQLTYKYNNAVMIEPGNVYTVIHKEKVYIAQYKGEIKNCFYPNRSLYEYLPQFYVFTSKNQTFIPKLRTFKKFNVNDTSFYMMKQSTDYFNKKMIIPILSSFDIINRRKNSNSKSNICNKEIINYILQFI